MSAYEVIHIIHFYTFDRARYPELSTHILQQLGVAKWLGASSSAKSDLRLWLSPGSRVLTQKHFSKTSRQGLGPEARQAEGLGNKSK